MAAIEEQVEFGGWLVTVLALLALLALTACEKKPSDPPQPRSRFDLPVASTTPSITPPAADPSVPSSTSTVAGLDPVKRGASAP